MTTTTMTKKQAAAKVRLEKRAGLVLDAIPKASERLRGHPMPNDPSTVVRARRFTVASVMGRVSGKPEFKSNLYGKVLEALHYIAQELPEAIAQVGYGRGALWLFIDGDPDQVDILRDMRQKALNRRMEQVHTVGSAEVEGLAEASTGAPVKTASEYFSYTDVSDMLRIQAEELTAPNRLLEAARAAKKAKQE